jgi:lysophospholipase L1-like esterase
LFLILLGLNDDVPNGSFQKQHVSFTLTKDKPIDAIIIGLPGNDAGNDFLSADQMRTELYNLLHCPKIIAF